MLQFDLLRLDRVHELRMPVLAARLRHRRRTGGS